ncbi:type IV pilus assembly protein PilB [Panacagrimonas perspica]|uniref:Type IV pilus assembly protein PilB n=1 Tax=Panacagrimonas perspica TaxID=381431 RepID=A0A4R7P5V9_9GAMM|nr:type IV-A pilus assembly ATPase PilB [Panacagrimonas perspica]TDU28410.1 type IV pilus assembly protein PilB [Panacagrimonas perspica]
MAINPQGANPAQSPSVFLGGLARRLVADSLITEEQARDLQAKALRTGAPLVTVLVEGKSVPAARLADAASQEFGVPLMDLAAFNIDNAVVNEVGEKLLRKCHALPLFKRGRKLFLGVSDPTNLQALDEIKFATGLTTEAILVEEDKLAKAIDAAASQMESNSLSLGSEEELANLEVVDTDLEGGGEVTKNDADDAPIVKFVNKLMVDAINQGASDIHFEPYEKVFRIRYRKDGELKIVASPPQQLAVRISARVKVMSRLDLAERRVPQDGRIKLQVSRNKSIDFRVSTCPTLWGEKIVCRILDASQAKMGIDALGYEPEQKAAYLNALEKPQGMILVTGPTGSGKTVSLYTGLNILNTEDINISTAEDPAEINLQGINQVNVNPRVGLTFAAALKAFLRQDPDVIMVGEIRDLETAEIAIKAAQTGHLVLSTLHTNDAPQTIVRLMNMGVPAYNLASTLTLIIAQRLARKLCQHCKKPTEIPRPELIKEGFKPEEVDAPGFKIFKAVGCDSCDRGYKGRTGIYEVMPFSEAMGRILMEGGSAMELADQARKEGISDLRASALLKVKNGAIDLLEANRVTMAD